MTDQKPLYTNRLIHQKSPYLLQHAHNPVDWYPWGEEAFLIARELDIPIFLSIGYATCHWCHVMERESFENIEVAQLMNKNFINIKVDREELPDVDGLYMEFAQSMMAGAAGWPLNMILTPELEPFFAATYLPPYSRHGMMGLTDLVQRIRELWSGEEREKVVHQAENVVDLFSTTLHSRGQQLPDFDIIQEAVELIFKMADPIYGGIKGAPKFPIGYQYCFLLRYYKSSRDSRALFLVDRTLERMHRGGIYDHLGGGFSRYSIDERWLVPHFEKMLYDNAIIGQSYLEAWQLTKKPLYRQICEEIISYLLRDMTHPEGAFYSAEDADSEGHEGWFYTWSYEEIMHVLGKDGALFSAYYGLTPEGNFEGRNILHTPLSLEEFAADRNLCEEDLRRQFASQREILWKEREKRIHPFKDDKILSGWNGLAIYFLTEAAQAFQTFRYLQAALKAAQFIKKNLWTGEELLRRFRDGQALFSASLDEYALMIRAALSLFEANMGTEWLEWAIEMTHKLTVSYKDREGAFFQTDGSDKNLIVRRCSFTDGAEPSGNAVHAENLIRLYQLTYREEYLKEAEDIFKAACNDLENYPPGYCYHLMSLLRYFDLKKPTLVVAMNSNRQFEKELKEKIFRPYLPHKAVIWQTHDVELEAILPSVKNQGAVEEKTALYICREGVCNPPFIELSEMEHALARLE